MAGSAVVALVSYQVGSFYIGYVQHKLQKPNKPKTLTAEYAKPPRELKEGRQPIHDRPSCLGL